MNQTPSQAISALLFWAFVYLLIFLVSTYFARTKGFLKLPFKNYKGSFCLLQHILVILCFFILSNLFIAPLIVKYLLFFLSYQVMLSLVPVIGFFLTLFIIYIYARAQRTLSLSSIVKDPLFPGRQTLKTDIIIGLKCFVLGIFPLFATMSLIEALFTYLNIDLSTQQSAIQYFLLMKNSPQTLILAIFTIVIAAPILEEVIFRGLIQTYLRSKLGSIQAIIFGSLFFSFFHFSTSQGIQNFAIITSLFVLSLYLGFAYEKTRSLISSITLHVTFNLINVIKIIFYSS